MNAQRNLTTVLIKAISDETSTEVLIYGTPTGLRLLATKILEIADLDQESMDSLPEAGGHHIQLEAGIDLCGESDRTVVGRIDGKVNGDFTWLLIPTQVGSYTTVKP
jgi:hypothetical protein